MTAQPQSKAETHVLQLTRQIKAAPAAVFAALTEAEALATWFGPEGVSAKNVKVDLTLGGAYSLEMHHKDELVTTLSGAYQEISPPNRLVFTWIWGMGDMAGVETLVTIELEENAEGCQLSLTHEGLPSAESVEKHSFGWTGCFNCLESHLAA
ncbi:MAG: SRPBCC domain-containing protein [Pseudomonadota bacterium]